MLDFRHRTFLALCRIRSYTKTAQALNLTQPAVSQHIKALEVHYGSPLFLYANKTLTLTEHGRLLYEYASRISADSDILAETLRKKDLAQPRLEFGATLSIGQYIMPSILRQVLSENPATSVSMLVENTAHLLQQLEQGEIQFALIEGLFDKSQYHSELFALEPFVGVCSQDSPLAHRRASLAELTGSPLIVREQGSGTREIFEHLLHGYNLSISSFAKVTEIGNMEAIKELVKDGLGITFLYQAAVREELAAGSLQQLRVTDMEVQHELNFVFLKNSLHAADFLAWFHTFRRIYDRIQCGLQ
jgi:DNA-binding transcriptional LysR family regulator